MTNYVVPHEKSILINKDTSIATIGKNLEKNQLVFSRWVFYILYRVRLLVYGETIKVGEYKFIPGMKLMDIYTKLVNGKTTYYRFTLIEGDTIDHVKLLINDSVAVDCSVKDMWSIEDLKEGSLLPDTYHYNRGSCISDLVNRMQRAQERFLSYEWEKRDKRIDSIVKNPYSAVILASIIEKETNIDSEKSLIAGVYINRLKIRMPLQACPTVIYGMKLDGKWYSGKLLYKHLKYPSNFNTYINRGLPPTPICNPSKSSIIAVLHPKWSKNLYFVASGIDGKHLFAYNLVEHQKNLTMIRKYN